MDKFAQLVNEALMTNKYVASPMNFICDNKNITGHIIIDCISSSEYNIRMVMDSNGKIITDAVCTDLFHWIDFSKTKQPQSVSRIPIKLYFCN